MYVEWTVRNFPVSLPEPKSLQSEKKEQPESWLAAQYKLYLRRQRDWKLTGKVE
jgi:hypothetical protein